MTVKDRMPADLDGLSTANLVSRAASQMSTLARDELALAKLELAAKGKKMGLGGGLFGAAGVLVLYGVGLLVVLAVVALDLVWPLWLAVLVVMLAVFAFAAIAALVGRRQFTRSTPPIPDEAVAGVTADIETIRTAVREGRHS